MRIARPVVTIVVLVLAGVLAHDAAAAKADVDVKDVKQARARAIAICQERSRMDCGLSQGDAWLMMRMFELGEPGLVALLELAGSNAPEATCALRFLVEIRGGRSSGHGRARAYTLALMS